MTIPREFHFQGKHLTLKEIAKITGMKYKTLTERIRRGVLIQKAVLGKSRAPKVQYFPVDKHLQYQLQQTFTGESICTY